MKSVRIARDPKTNEAGLVVSRRNAPGVVLVGPPARYLLADLYYRSIRPGARVSVYTQAESGDLLRCDVRGGSIVTDGSGRMTREWEVVLYGSGETVEYFVATVRPEVKVTAYPNGSRAVTCNCGQAFTNIRSMEEASAIRSGHLNWHEDADAHYQVASDGYSGD